MGKGKAAPQYLVALTEDEIALTALGLRVAALAAHREGAAGAQALNMKLALKFEGRSERIRFEAALRMPETAA